MTVSTIPALFFAQALFFISLALKTRTGVAFLSEAIVVAILGAWGVGSATMALNGVYDTEAFLRLMPGLWLPAVPFLLVSFVILLPAVRRGILGMADAVSPHWFVAIQTLRVLALGTLIKTI